MVLLACFGVFTAAQEPDPEKPPSYQVFTLGEMYVMGEKPPAVDNVGIKTEITAEQITATNSSTVAEALSHVSGLRVSTGRKNEASAQIHGINQNKLLVLIDGVPYYETYNGKLDLNQIPTENIAKIEVTKGAASVLYGPNALGGVINIITKKPSDKPAAQLVMEIGENDSGKVSLTHGMKKGIFNYWLNYTHRESDGWRMSGDYEPRMGTVIKKPGGVYQTILEDGGSRESSGFKSDSFWAKIGVEPRSGSEYYLNFHLINREKEYPPSTDKVTVFAFRPAFSHFARMPRYDDWGIDLSGQQKVAEKLTLKAKLFYHDHMDDWTSYSDETFSDEIAISRYKDYLIGGAFFADYRPAQWNILRFSYNLKKDSHCGRDDEYLPYEESLSKTGSLAFENEFTRVENLSVVLGASYDWFRVTEARENVTDSQTGDFLYHNELETGDTKHQLNPMIGATYNFGESTRFYGSIAKKIHFPTLSNLYSSRGGNIDLKPERAVNYTLGVSHIFEDKGEIEFSLYKHRITDFITWNKPYSSGGELENVGKITLSGFEITGSFTPLEYLSFTGSYCYTRARDKSFNRATENVVDVPQDKIDFGIRYMIPYIKTQINLNTTYVSRYYSELPTVSDPFAEDVITDGYGITSLRLSKSFTNNLEGYIAVNNIFDKNYESEKWFPGPGRNFYVGIAIRY